MQLKLLKRIMQTRKILHDAATRQCPMSGTTIRRKDTDKNKLGLTLEDYVNIRMFHL